MNISSESLTPHFKSVQGQLSYFRDRYSEQQVTCSGRCNKFTTNFPTDGIETKLERIITLLRLALFNLFSKHDLFNDYETKFSTENR